MKAIYHVEVIGFHVVSELEGVWTRESLAALLVRLGVDDITGMDDAEVREMAVLGLQDMKPDEAAEVVLAHQLSDRLKPGQISNMSHEMSEEKQWEYYADPAFHEGLFNVGSLLYEAFSGLFYRPDAVRVELKVSAKNEAAQTALGSPLHESFLVRLLADGMKETAPLRRLFSDQLNGSSFPEADSIVWIASVDVSEGGSVHIDLTSSRYWFDALRGTESFDSTAYCDEVSDTGA